MFDRLERRPPNVRAAAIVYLIALVLQGLIWFVFYEVAGYSDATVSVACGLTLLLGLIAVAWLGLGLKQVGLGVSKLLQALFVAAIAHVLLILVGLVMNALGGDIQIFRSSYSLSAMLNNWVLTAFGEELVFAGVIYTSLVAERSGRRWAMVPLVALLFAVWHFPGYLAIGLDTGSLSGRVLGDLAINMASWLFFGAMYSLSRNLWLVTIAHASTDYGLLPMITRDPLIGFVFIVMLLLGGWLVTRERRSTGRQFLRTPRAARHLRQR